MESYANHAGLALAELVLHPADLVHSFHIPIAWAATGWSAITSRPLILSLTGYPDARSLAAFRGRERMLRRAAARARRVHVLSLAAARALKATTGIDPVVLHPGTDLSAFRVEAERAKQPTILCAASPADPRKRVPDLVAAFSLLRRRHPDARLLIDCGGGRPVEPERLRAPGVELIDVDTPDRGGIAKAYATSWLSVLPSEREAFGLVLVESLAAGTPAVGMWDGAAPEIIDDPRVGVVAQERSPEALATALGDGLELAARPETRERCRSHSTRWGWDRVGPAYEQLYADALAEAN